MNNEEFKAKILPHYKSMYRVAASIMGSDIEAADAVQDAMLRLWDKRNQLKNVSNMKSYSLNVVRNVCINIIQRRKITSDTEDRITDVESDKDIHSAVEWRDASDFVIKAMNRLPADQKRVLQLSAFGGFSNAEIADLLGTTQGNVRVILSRARNKIKVLLSK